MKLSPSLNLALELVEYGYSYSEVVDKKQRGLISDPVYRWWMLLWNWSTFRMQNNPQERYYAARGSEAYCRRINRCRAFLTAHTTITLEPIS